MRVGLVIVGLVFQIGCTPSTSGRVLEYGIYERVKMLPEKIIVSGPDSRQFKTAEFELIERTSVIPAQLGVCFGYEFEIENIPPGNITEAQIIIVHPTLIEPDGEPSDGYIYTVGLGDGKKDVWKSKDHYCFDHEYEVRPGRWLFQIRRGKEILVQQSFDVVKNDS